MLLGLMHYPLCWLATSSDTARHYIYIHPSISIGLQLYIILLENIIYYDCFDSVHFIYAIDLVHFIYAISK